MLLLIPRYNLPKPLLELSGGDQVVEEASCYVDGSYPLEYAVRGLLITEALDRLAL